MGKIRVYELAKEFNLSNKDLVQKLQSMGYSVKSHSSTLEDYQLKEIRSRLQSSLNGDVAESKGRPTVIRRRKKVTSEAEDLDENAGDEEQAEDADELEKPEVRINAGPVTAEDTQSGQPGTAEEPSVPVPAATTAVSEVPEGGAAAPKEQRVVRIGSRTDAPARIIAPAPEPTVEKSEIKSEKPLEADVETRTVEESEEKPQVKTQTEGGLEPRPEQDVREASAETPAPEPEKPGVEKISEVKEERPVAAGAVEGAGSVSGKPVQTEPKQEGMPESERKLRPAVKPEDAAKSKLRAKPKQGPEVEPESRNKLKIKKIEKTTSEPAKIISKPREMEHTPEVVSRPAPKRPERPREVAPQRPQPRNMPAKPAEQADFPPAPDKESKKSRKKKRGKEQVGTDQDTDRKRGTRRREIIEKTDLYGAPGWDRPSRGRRPSKAVKKTKKTEITVPKAIKRRIKVDEAISVADLAKKMGIKSGDVIKQLMSMGVMANLNQAVDFDTAILVASEFGFEVERGSFDEEEVLHVQDVTDAERLARPPVVTVMGHVDHGKTSLLDAIRKTNVTSGEAGGITQHIGAYHVQVPGGRITFLDTPGHEAFTAMRARGAQVTDIVVLIVAADDGVMQQTREAADHARAAGVPIIVAVNKIDKPEADPERIRREVSDLGLVPEDWGGDTIFANISAKKGIGIEELLDLILIQAEMLELKAPAENRAKGHVIEARLDKGRGPVATVLVHSGKLKQGDPYVCGVFHGKVRAMFDDRGQRVDEAGPSIPVEIQGIAGVPQAGDEFVVVEDEKQAKQVSQHRQLKQRETELLKTSKLTLENLFDSIKEGALKELNLVLKADVQGSLEAISDALVKLGTEAIKVNLIHSSTGAITESDIMLASASNALVVGFNVRPAGKVQELADRENVQIRYYDVIYKLIDEIKEAMAGMLAPIDRETVLGRAEVRDTFHVSKVGTIAGCSVTDGKVVRGAKARLLRDSVVIYDGKITSLKRFKEDAREVLSGYECGIGLENFNDIKVGDVIEPYIVEQIAATLD